jgi:hypothetical protein
MQTEIYESDPFTAKKSGLLASVESDYRFQKNDELYIHHDTRTMKIRVIDVRVHLRDGKLSREVLGMKL